MPIDQNQPKKPISEENSIPPSPQEPTEQGTENTTDSEPSEALPEAPEASRDDFPVKSTDIAPSNSALKEQEKEPEIQENQSQNEILPEPQPGADQPLAEVSEPEETPEPKTAQMGRNEPLEEQDQKETKPEKTEPKPTKSIEEQKPLDEARDKPRISYLKSQKIREILAKASLAIQNKKRKKLDSILTLFAKRTKITNDEVEKFLHVSDATATRYLSILEKEGKIKQNGKTGHMVSYSRI